jgi:hypothetical protein
VRALIGDNTQSVFHLAAIVSGQAEAEFDLGIRIIFDATRHLLEALRALPQPARLVFSSSLAVFGAAGPDDVPNPVRDDTALTPLSRTARRGDGRVMVNVYSRGLRRRHSCGATITVRRASRTPPHRRSRAASFEPLNGVDASSVRPDTRMGAVAAQLFDNLLTGHEVDAKAFGGLSRRQRSGMRSHRRHGRCAGACRRRRTLRAHPVAHDPRIDRIVST